ncbi:ParM/StbA family protein [Phormidesmis sp. 146-12]
MTTITNVLTTDSESLTESLGASSSLNIAVGLDVGNGGVKLYSGMGEILMESYLHFPRDRYTSAVNGYVEYLAGDRSDLVGKHWMGGIGAYYADPVAISRTVDSRDGKVAQCLQLLLSALSLFPYRAELNLNIAASVHDGKTFGKQIRQALEGTHRVKLRGKECTVNVQLSYVVEEGSGVAIALLQKCDFSNALLFDFGNGTAIFSSFTGVQMTDRQFSVDSGVEGLISAIANSDSVRKALLKPADKHLIRAGIEKGDFSYGTQRPDWNFREAYAAEFPNWFKRGMLPFVKAVENRMPSASAVLAVGGGAMLPGVKSALAQKGITVPDSPRWVNAQGLYMLALRANK